MGAVFRFAFACLITNSVACSEDGTFSFGYSKLVGKRMSMEDFHDARIDTVGGRTIGLFGVYDGERGYFQ